MQLLKEARSVYVQDRGVSSSDELACENSIPCPLEVKKLIASYMIVEILFLTGISILYLLLCVALWYLLGIPSYTVILVIPFVCFIFGCRYFYSLCSLNKTNLTCRELNIGEFSRSLQDKGLVFLEKYTIPMEFIVESGAVYIVPLGRVYAVHVKEEEKEDL